MDNKELKKELEHLSDLLHSLMCSTYGIHRLIEDCENRCAELSSALSADDGGCDHDL